MKILLTTIAAVLLVGCGESQQSAPPAKPESALEKSMKSALKQGVSNARAKRAVKRAVLKAVKKGDIEAVKQAITDGTDVNADGFLVAAIKEGHKEITELLIAEGANVNGRETSFEGSPLHQAVSQDMQEIIELLITKGANVNVKDMFFTLTPLDWAVKLKKTETIKLLQKHGGKSAAEDSIHFAVQLGNFEAVKKHLDAGADINSTAEGLHETPLDFTEEIKGGNSLKAFGLPKEFADTVEIKAAKKEIADFLRKRGGKHSSIFEAAKGGDLEGIKEFLAAGVDPDEKTGFTFGATPLCVASTKEVAELLIAKGADVNTVVINSGTPLHYAVQRGYKEIAELLINKGADINFYKRGVSETPLNRANRYKQIETAELLRKYGGKTRLWFKAEESIHIAVKVGHIEAVKQHIAAGADVNAKDKKGETPLLQALGMGYKEIVELLIAKGADVNANNGDGYTPLDLAAGNKETADLLRKHGGKTRKELEAAELGVSVEVLPDISIHQAAGSTGRTSNIEAIKQYLAIGKDVDARDKQDKTPLQHAAYWGHKEIAKLLIANGADINAKDNAGKTTLDWGRRGKNQTEIADLLRKHGAKTSEELKAEPK